MEEGRGESRESGRAKRGDERDKEAAR